MATALCVGHCTVDTIGLVEQFPAPEDNVELSAYSLQGGGAAANAAIALAALGVSTRFFGKVSDDWLGRYIRQGFEESGVDVAGLVVAPGVVSAANFILVDRRTRRRTVFASHGNVPPLKPDEVDLAVVGHATAVLVDGFQPEAQIAVAEAARRREIPVLLDAGGASPGIEQLAAKCSVIVASERFARDLAGSVDKSVESLLKLGPRCAVVTLGEDGCVGREAGGTTVICQALAVEAVDTTGAGDVFRGAFLFGMVQRWDLRQRLRFASAAAGLSCRALGARAGLPERKEIDQALASDQI